MTGRTLSLAEFAGRTGRGVRVAVVDSGIHATHPHIGGIAGGVSFDREGRIGDDVVDRLGHGTAVAAAIHEKAPDAPLLAVKVFDRTLETAGLALVAAIRWAARAQASIINLSLGTTNNAHEQALAEAIADAARSGSLVVAAAPTAASRWLPGALPGVIAVEVDWDCPREIATVTHDGATRLRASGFPRPIAGVPPERNVKGQSFAVANVSGLLAVAIEGKDRAGAQQLVVDLFDSRAAGRAP